MQDTVPGVAVFTQPSGSVQTSPRHSHETVPPHAPASTHEVSGGGGGSQQHGMPAPPQNVSV